MECLFLLLFILFVGISFFSKIYLIKKEFKKSKIPYGDYCYTPFGFKDGKYKVKVCPYWEYGEDEDGCSYGYCHYIKERDYILLWDSVKICGENEYE